MDYDVITGGDHGGGLELPHSAPDEYTWAAQELPTVGIPRIEDSTRVYPITHSSPLVIRVEPLLGPPMAFNYASPGSSSAPRTIAQLKWAIWAHLKERNSITLWTIPRERMKLSIKGTYKVLLDDYELATTPRATYAFTFDMKAGP